jgi:hypothetical protein
MRQLINKLVKADVFQKLNQRMLLLAKIAGGGDKKTEKIV